MLRCIVCKSSQPAVRVRLQMSCHAMCDSCAMCATHPPPTCALDAGPLILPLPASKSVIKRSSSNCMSCCDRSSISRLQQRNPCSIEVCMHMYVEAT